MNRIGARLLFLQVSAAFITFIIGAFCTTVLAQKPNPKFPKIASFQWGGAVPEWYARHDLLMASAPRDRESGRAWAQRIKQLNPNVIILPTLDWNYGPQIYESLPDEWYLKTSKGEKIPIYGQGSGLYLMNISRFCPTVNGKKYYEYATEWQIERVDFSVYDGIATDGLWDYPWGTTDVDYDRNGRNDYVEHGKDWVRQVQTEGAELALRHARSLIGDNRLILVNSGGFHKFGKEFSNGIVNEHFTAVSDLDWLLEQYRSWEYDARKPHVTLIDGLINPDETGGRGKNNFRDMLFGLATTLMYGGYYCAQPFEGGEHYFTTWYDEFDIDLGQPKADPIKLSSGVYVRFFDFGVVLLNGSGRDQTIHDAQLASLPGYDGPYYFFKGGQNPSRNNGKQFNHITLKSWKDANGWMEGDGAILLKEPVIVVTDIIIDDSEAGTSPSCEPIKVQGPWKRLFERDPFGDAYTMRVASWHSLVPMSAMYAADPGNGNAQATFEIRVGVAGNYEVFEWHGYLGNDRNAVREGTNVPYTIRHANGQKTILVDQSQNAGRWNSLGIFPFRPGVSQYVRLDNRANGPVIADAIRLVFRDGSASNSGDQDAPSPPKGVSIELKKKE